MGFYEDAMEIIADLDPKTKAKMKAIIEEVIKDEGGKVEKGIKTYKILAMDGRPGDMGAEGYMDDGSDSYKRFAVDRSGKFYILAEYPKSEYGDEYMFREIMGKFDPDVFFMRDGVEVDSMDLTTLSDIYWSTYDE